MVQSMLNSALNKGLEYKSVTQNPHRFYVMDLIVPIPFFIWEKFEAPVVPQVRIALLMEKGPQYGTEIFVFTLCTSISSPSR